MSSIRLYVKNDLTELKRIHPQVNQFLDSPDLSPSTVYAVNFALEEILTNIIKFAYDDQAEHEIYIVLEKMEGEVEIEIVDDGKKFNPLTVPPPDMQKPAIERSDHGVGLHLLRGMVESAEYSRLDAENILKLRVRGSVDMQ